MVAGTPEKLDTGRGPGSGMEEVVWEEVMSAIKTGYAPAQS